MNLSALTSSYVTQVIASLVIALVGFALGTSRRAILHRLRTRQTRRYWEPFRERGLAIVLGSFSSSVPSGATTQNRGVDPSGLYEFEPYGLVGFGDVLALLAVQEHLRSLSWGSIEIVQSKDAREVREKNLVLIGGPDANVATDLAMQSGRLPVKFETVNSGRTQMRISYPPDATGAAATDEIYTPTFSVENPLQITRDFGFVAHLPNPYARESRAILLVGVYGAGTAAAGQLVTTAYGVSKLMRLKAADCIAVFRADVSRAGDIAAPQVDRCVPLP